MFVDSKFGIVADTIKADGDVSPVDKYNVLDDIFVDTWLVINALAEVIPVEMFIVPVEILLNSAFGIVAIVIKALALVRPTTFIAPKELFVPTAFVTCNVLIVPVVINALALVNPVEILIVPVETFVNDPFVINALGEVMPFVRFNEFAVTPVALRFVVTTFPSVVAPLTFAFPPIFNPLSIPTPPATTNAPSNVLVVSVVLNIVSIPSTPSLPVTFRVPVVRFTFRMFSIVVLKDNTFPIEARPPTFKDLVIPAPPRVKILPVHAFVDSTVPVFCNDPPSSMSFEILPPPSIVKPPPCVCEVEFAVV